MALEPPAHFVSVLMPVFNGACHLRDAIESIISQTHQNWELLIADDGSTDDSASIAKEYVDCDSRVHLLRFPHRGLVATLNAGVRSCTGRYLFRMDCDDVSMPTRLERQISYLEKHDNVVVLGCLDVSSLRHLISPLTPKSPQDCRWQLVFRNCIGHPGVAIRRSAIHRLDPYRSDYFLSEDFKLWNELSAIGDVHVLPEPLLIYRKHDQSLSHKYRIQQCRVDRMIVAENLNYHFNLDISNSISLPAHKWAIRIIDGVIGSTLYAEASQEDRTSIRRGLEIYIARYGTRALIHLLRVTRFSDILDRPSLILTNLARSIKAEALKELP